MDSRTFSLTPESGTRVSYNGTKCTKGSKLHLAMATLDHLLALRITPATEQEQVEAFAGSLQ